MLDQHTNTRSFESAWISCIVSQTYQNETAVCEEETITIILNLYQFKKIVPEKNKAREGENWGSNNNKRNKIFPMKATEVAEFVFSVHLRIDKNCKVRINCNANGYTIKLGYNDHGYNEFTLIRNKMMSHFGSQMTGYKDSFHGYNESRL